MSTSIHKGRILFDAAQHDNNETLSADLARTVVNNVLHACDSAAQVRVTFPLSDEGIGLDDDGITTTTRLLARVGPFPLNVRADGRAYPVRVRLGAKNSAAGTNVLTAYIHPYRSFFPGADDAAGSAIVTSTTAAWYDTTVDTLAWPSLASTEAARLNLSTIDAVGGNPVTAEQALFVCSVYGVRASGTSNVEICGLYVAEYCGYEYDPLRDLPSLAHAYEAGSWTLDSSDNVSSWTDLVGDEDLDQATTADMPVADYSDSNFLNRATVNFDASNTEYLQAQTAAAWRFLHNGTDHTVLCVLRHPAPAGTEVIFDTTVSFAASAVGQSLQIFASNWYAFIRNGTGTTYTQAGPGSISSSDTQVLCVQFDSTDHRVSIDGSQVAIDTSYAGSPDAGDPNGALAVGAGAGNSAHITASIAALYFCKQRLTDAELTTFQSWATAKHGA